MELGFWLTSSSDSKKFVLTPFFGVHIHWLPIFFWIHGKKLATRV